MIIHTVAFKLKHAPDSEDEGIFIEKARALSAIDGVGNFGVYRQVSEKNPYDFNLAMEFADQAAYDFYNQHPDHQGFVHNIWLPEVEDFLEADFVELID